MNIKIFILVNVCYSITQDVKHKLKNNKEFPKGCEDLLRSFMLKPLHIISNC